MQPPLIVDWTEEQILALEHDTLVARHRLHESEVFTDAGLARLLDKHPDEHLSVSTMGADYTRNEWREGDRAGLSGEELVEALKRGRLWLNLRRSVEIHPEIAELVNGAYDELEKLRPGFRAGRRTANLLLSSPNCQVYYHLDAPLNMLWHLRGGKRVWVYPLNDDTVSRDNVENVISGAMNEDLPYWPDLDKHAETFDLKPGEVITWAQHTPHRVTNFDSFNVSLSTEHYTRDAVRRVNVHLANQYLRKTWHLPGCADSNIHGPCAAAKIATIRVMRRVWKLTRRQPPRYKVERTFRVDLDAPNCIRDYVAAPTAQEAVPQG